tara:strand:+ start:1622 stop:2338 length:717 start_codon:yes stop_codon:yes gene_type:complete
MKVVILAGGLGTRFGDMTKLVPKPMLKIGKFPILVHLIDNFSKQGFDDFIICTGYKHDYINSFFENNSVQKGKNVFRFKNSNINLQFTGIKTNTGGRLYKIKNLVEADTIITYGDGLSDIDINEVVNFNKKMKTLLTISVTNAVSRFGVVNLSQAGIVNQFEEKGVLNELINMGFMVAKPEFFDILDKNDVLETVPMKKLLQKKQLSGYQHKGIFFPIDTQRDLKQINSMYRRGDKFW